MSATKTYTFDVKLFATITVPGCTSEHEARMRLTAELNGAEANFGRWPHHNDDPILGQVSIDGDADLMDEDGPDMCASCGRDLDGNGPCSSDDCPGNEESDDD